VIIEGTRDVHQPLFRSLKRSLKNTVHLIEHSDREYLAARLKELAGQSEAWVFPSNEVTLNAVHEAVDNTEMAKDGRLRIPGTANIDRLYSSAEVSDKEILFHLLKDSQFKMFDKLQTRILHWKDDGRGLDVLEDLKFPVTIKPVSKDKDDTFTGIFPAKILIAESSEQFFQLLEQYRTLFYDRKFLIQELVEGKDISWFGRIYKESLRGYSIDAVVKSPVGASGGTTTLARLEPVDDNLAMAVNELARALGLDGIFEIEFILHNDRLVFNYEINPRPILQISMILQQEPNVIVEYLLKQGFTPLYKKPKIKNLPQFWGSASRYLKLNKDRGISLKTFFRTAAHDVRFSEFTRCKDKVFYLFSLMKSLFAKMCGCMK